MSEFWPQKVIVSDGFNPKFVKHTVVDGKIVAVIGKADGGKL